MQNFVSPKQLPPQITRAMALVVSQAGHTHYLSNNARLLLCELLRSTSVRDPHQSVRISTATLCIRLLLSPNSIYRLKAELEMHGWITRKQLKSRRFGMQVSDVYWTSEAISHLQLDLPAVSIDKPSSDLKEPTIPADLQFLRQLGISASGIFLLMSLCKRNGMLLSDVANASKAYLLNAGRPFKYLKHVICTGKNIDWKRRRSGLDSAAVEQGSPTTKTFGLDSASFSELMSLFAGNMAYTTRDRNERFLLIGGSFIAKRKKECRHLNDASELYELYKSGQLIPI